MAKNSPIKLIINADDYGYFDCVSHGIIEAASSHALTAAGIIANRLDLSKQLKLLDSVPNLDLGVHLNLTFGKPLSSPMRKKLAVLDGFFPGVYQMSRLILQGAISINDVRREWSAQIEACQHKTLWFLNSHEHIHMLPMLFSLTIELAQNYKIPQVRLTRAEWSLSCLAEGFIRNALMQTMASINQLKIERTVPIFLGLQASGKLNLSYLQNCFSQMPAGKVYELMCHPGCFDPDEITDAKLLAYHDWEGELALLKSPELHNLYEKYGIQLTHYRDL